MKMKYLVLGKKSFEKDGKKFYVVKLLVQQCEAFPVIAGSVVQKFVDEKEYDSIVVDPMKTLEHGISIELSESASYADVHLKINLIQ